ncbi:MAG: hypothetical protein V1816_08330 [Pseudomonadota bacterium]
MSDYNRTVEGNYRINVRFAVNFGETRVDETGDRHGAAVNMAFRVESLRAEDLVSLGNGADKEKFPHENRILVTENVAIEPFGIDKIETRLVGLFELKGITGLHKIFQITPVK